MDALAHRVGGSGRVYLVGGASALLMQWRNATVDIDIKAEPEPLHFFEAIAELKDSLDTNVELASPDLFLPELRGWRERSLFIVRIEKLDYFHYDFYAQALAKIERGHARDMNDVVAMCERGLIEKTRLKSLFEEIRPQLIRFPAINVAVFTEAVYEFCR